MAFAEPKPVTVSGVSIQTVEFIVKSLNEIKLKI